MQVALYTLRKFLDQISFNSNGDGKERRYGCFTSGYFPNCEKFWRLFIVPLTKRLEGYPEQPSDDIKHRRNISPELEDISAVHYSLFINLVYAYTQLENSYLSKLEDFYVHLVSTCDLAEIFLEKCYLLLLKCRGRQSKVLQRLTHEEFIKFADKWYEEKYTAVFEHYLSSGKYASMKLPSHNLLVKEFLVEYLGQGPVWKDYQSHSRPIREFRNVVVHDIQVGGLKINGKAYIPKPKAIQEYRTWRKVFAVKDLAVKDQDAIIDRDFADPAKQLPEDLHKLESILNIIWGFIINEFKLEFYSEERKVLRNLYQIEI